MTKLETLLILRKALTAKKQTHDLDFLFWKATECESNPKSQGIARYADPSRSIDAAIWLVEHALPGWAWKIGTCSVSDDAWIVPDFNDPIHGPRLLAEFGPIVAGSVWDVGFDIDQRPPGRVAIALCRALVEALIVIEGVV